MKVVEFEPPYDLWEAAQTQVSVKKLFRVRTILI